MTMSVRNRPKRRAARRERRGSSNETAYLLGTRANAEALYRSLEQLRRGDVHQIPASKR